MNTVQVVLRQEQKQVTLRQNIEQVTLKQEQNPITLKQCVEQIILRQKFPQIIIRGGPIVVNILPFSVIATENGQTVFYLYDQQGNPLYYSQIICFFIMGTGQNIIVGDYTFNGNVVTLGPSAPGIDVGDVIFGSGMT